MPQVKNLYALAIIFAALSCVFAQKDLKFLFKENPHRKSLNMANVTFDQHQKLFTEFPYLSEIKLYNTPKHLPKALFLTPMLQSLYIANTRILATDSNFRFAPRLQHLIFEKTEVVLDTHFYMLPKLEALNFIHCSVLWRLPHQIDPILPALKELVFYKTPLDTLNLSNKKLENLQTLVVKNCQLHSLDSIKGLKNIKYLILDSNKLHILPKDILSLKTLNVLSLKGNYLNHIPEEIYRLKNLEVLNLTGNTISATALLELQALLPRTEIIYVRND